MKNNLYRRVTYGIKQALKIGAVGIFFGATALQGINFVGRRITDPQELRQVLSEEARRLNIKTNNIEIILGKYHTDNWLIGGRILDFDADGADIYLTPGLGNTRNVIAHELYHKYERQQRAKKLPTPESNDFITDMLGKLSYKYGDQPDCWKTDLANFAEVSWCRAKYLTSYVFRREPKALLYGALRIKSD